HQTKNAMSLVNKNAAILVKDSEALAKLVTEAVKLAADNAKQQELRQNIAKLALPNAAEVITNEVLKLVKKPL
ncbi:MAG TPA: UDP-N-acetylglucosamine--N-acetylmuramyl-(pentapeptide) pyrophosphoryl-undecaprenol N-acetylglucosamine transferase, partial [Bacteroidia bacterium]|nr:UDP-N-acetylglucosamine--N-acetylmuramyl-(pentapeptide) pyrophosphoryl-undecaprenol N-acetylglucosamine transferase [Bacteroidia bacterium]